MFTGHDHHSSRHEHITLPLSARLHYCKPDKLPLGLTPEHVLACAASYARTVAGAWKPGVPEVSRRSPPLALVARCISVVLSDYNRL